jgi:hypothetical protein
MNTRYLIALVLGLSAVAVAINCAPMDPSAEEAQRAPTSRAEQTPRPTEQVPVLPSDVVARIQPTGQPATAPAAPDALEQRIKAAMTQVRRRKLRTDNGFWTVLHYILGLGLSVELYNPETKGYVNAFEYIASGGKVPGVHFFPTPYGLDVETGPGTFTKQGHQDQFIAEMVEWAVPTDYRFVVEGKNYFFDDFLQHTKMRVSVQEPQELEWAIVIIATRFGTNIEWTNGAGEHLHFEDLIRAALAKDTDKAACGGTHMLFGLTWAYYLHLKNGGQTVGVWKEVADKIASYKNKARELQNPDGSLSTGWFKERGNNPSVDERIRAPGHMIEWLSLAMSDDELRQPWMQSAVSALSMTFLENQHQGLDGGSMYHAVHGLLLYYSRVYGADKLPEGERPHAPLPPAKQK